MEWDDGWRLKIPASTGGGLNDVVDDTSPQLGGQLDVNGQSIGDGTLELLTFTETASAVNQVNIANAATGNSPTISAVGDDTNIGLILDAKGTGAIRFADAAVPNANDGAALGTTSLKWSDLHLASGAVINWDNWNMSLTHSPAFSYFLGGTIGIYYSGTCLELENTQDSASVRVATFGGDRATPTDGDEAYIRLRLSDDAGNDDEFARITWKARDVSSTSEDGEIQFDVMVGGALTNVFTMSANRATSGVGTTPTSSTTTTVTHGLGRTPKIVRIWGKSGFTSNASATPTTSSVGLYTASGNTCIYQSINGTTTIAAQTSTSFAIFLDTSVGNNVSGVIGNVGATSFDIVWTETGTHTRGVYMWEAE